MAQELVEIMERPVSLEVISRNFQNKKLAQHTAAIEKLMNATKRNMFEIAVRFCVIRDEKLYEDDNYADVFDYAEKVLSYKKNMVYKMTMAAEKFIEKDADNKRYISIMAHESEDYTVSQLIELNTLEPETAKTLDENGVIAPTMSTKKIREAVKAYKNGEITVDSDGGNDEAESGDNEPDNSKEEAKAIKTAIKALKRLEETLRFNDVTANMVNNLIAELENMGA